jgi:hypothetical protein
LLFNLVKVLAIYFVKYPFSRSIKKYINEFCSLLAAADRVKQVRQQKVDEVRNENLYLKAVVIVWQNNVRV